MIFLIDGHNLIPHIPGLSLKELDDECQLIGMLQEFSRVSRQRVEVYFDKAPAGQSGTRNYGAVKAHFIREDSTADEAIISGSEALAGRRRAAWSLPPITGCKTRCARCMPELSIQASLQRDHPKIGGDKKSNDSDQPVDAAQVEYWLKRFSSKK